MEKKFKPFQKVLARFKGNNWICDLYSHYDTKTNAHITIGFCDLEDDCILPYEGNENLVGTTDEPETEVKLEEGEWVMAKTDNGNWVLAKYKKHWELPWNNIDVVFSNERQVSVDYVVRFSDFNPNDMEETKKHILCVKNGKIVRYKG